MSNLLNKKGIKIGGDGMGGRGGRKWGFGDDSEDESISYTTKGARGRIAPLPGGDNNGFEPLDAMAPPSRSREQVPERTRALPKETKVPSAGVSAPQNNMDGEAHKEIYAEGLALRKKVVGPDYVEKSLNNNQSDFLRPMVQFATESAWGTIWTRPGLELKTRSLLNLSMLTALNKWTELGTHVRGAIRNGASEVEIRETLLQAASYCGVPAGMEAFRVADKVLADMKFKGEL